VAGFNDFDELSAAFRGRTRCGVTTVQVDGFFKISKEGRTVSTLFEVPFDHTTSRRVHVLTEIIAEVMKNLVTDFSIAFVHGTTYSDS
jgi:hypothetical protein